MWRHKAGRSSGEARRDVRELNAAAATELDVAVTELDTASTELDTVTVELDATWRLDVVGSDFRMQLDHESEEGRDVSRMEVRSCWGGDDGDLIWGRRLGIAAEVGTNAVVAKVGMVAI